MSEETKVVQASWAAALVGAQTAARAVGKDRTNDFHRYKYASAEAIIAEAREALSYAGLSVYLAEMAYEPAADEAGTGERGLLVLVYVVEHVSGEARRFIVPQPVICERTKSGGARPLDKAIAAARTYALGYFLRDLLLLPRVEKDADVDQRDDGPQEEGRRDRRHERDPAPADVEAFAARIAAATTLQELVAVGKELSDARLSNRQVDALRNAYSERRAALSAPPKEAA